MSEPKGYPIGVQSFSEIIRHNLYYVDKTEYVYRLVKENKYYFLSRPRRFGKSLLLSTLEAFFRGQRELFKGLAISRHDDIDWEEYPVLHFDFNAKDYTHDDASLYNHIDSRLTKWEERYGIKPKIMDLDTRFADVVTEAHRRTGRQVVILVDEYDRPLLQNIGKANRGREEKFRNMLKGIFGVLKSCDRHIRFAFLTGITKFGRVSVFSDLNNLRDISLLRDYNAICGISESELTENFSEPIEYLGRQYGLSYAQTCAKLKRDYDGYRFTSWETEGIYNPFSLLNAFNNREFGDYWFVTATPTMLIELLKESDWNLFELDGTTRTENELMGLDPVFSDPIPVLFQSGYLTIKGTEKDGRKLLFRLGFPNEEVESGFLDALLPYYVDKTPRDGEFRVSRFIDALRNGNVDSFMELLKSLMAGISYNESSDRIHENRFRNAMFIICRLIGLSAYCEIHSSLGRIDMTIKVGNYIYVMEFKVDESPQEALAQIDRKHYTDRYMSEDRTIVKVGVEFSTSERNIKSWAYKTNYKD